MFLTGFVVGHARLRALLRPPTHCSPRSARARRADSTDLALYVAASCCGTLMASSPEMCIAAAQDRLLVVCAYAEAPDLEVA